MNRLILAALAFATPAIAQTTQPQAPQPDQTTTSQPAPTDPNAQTDPNAPPVANTPLSNQPVPSNGPRAQQGDTPANNAAARAGGGEMTPPTYAPAGTPVATPSPAEAMPAPAPLDHYPICKANQFDKCMEPGHRSSSKARARRRPR